VAGPHLPYCQREESDVSSTGTAHRRIKGLGLVIFAKLIAVALVLVLFRVLQVEFGVGIAVLALAHFAVLGGLIIYGLRAGVLRRPRG
jgi:type IV secretory pathway TrbD component